MDRNIQMQVKTSDGYDNLYPQTSINNVQGIQDQYYDKEAIISNNTLTSLGLSESSTPDDVFQLLGRFNNNLGNEYLWGKGTYAENLTAIGRSLILSYSPEYSTTAEYGDSISFDSEGNAFIVNSQTVQVGYAADGVIDGQNFINLIKGKYVLCNNVLYKFDSGAKFSVSTKLSKYIYVESGGNTVESKIATFGYVNSQYDDAYPPSVPDGYVYNALGRLGDKANIVTGSYVGTGTYGASNPNTLTFDFEPKLVVINGMYAVSAGTISIFVRGMIYYTAAYSNEIQLTNFQNCSFLGVKMSWYSTRSDLWQLNESGATYYYIALG